MVNFLLFQHEVQSGSGAEDLKNQDTILNVTSGILHFVGDSLVPDTIDKNYLEGAKVLQQVDKKYIPIVAGTTLAIIDQVYSNLCIVHCGRSCFLVNFLYAFTLKIVSLRGHIKFDIKNIILFAL